MTENQVQYKTWMCLICGFVYDEAAGLPCRRHLAGHTMGRRADELDLSECGARKEDFEMVEI